MKKPFSGLLLLGTILVIIICFLGYYFITKKDAVPVRIIRVVAPEEGIWNSANLESVATEKRYHVYNYRLRFEVNFDGFGNWDFNLRDYLKDHPSDVAMIEWVDSANYIVEIFTDKIDENIFKFDENGRLVAYL